MTIGKTNDFPRGKFNGSDEGGLQSAIAVQDKTVIVAFGTSVEWIGMDKDTAIAVANGILEKANAI
jgi:hypothetical protein